MLFLHTADWHIGKTLKGRSRLAEQREVLAEIIDIAVREQVDAVLTEALSLPRRPECCDAAIPTAKRL